MVRGRGHERSQASESQNPEFTLLLFRIQQRFKDQAAFMQQQATVIQGLQQQQGRMINPAEERFGDGEYNNQGGHGDGGNNNNGMSNRGPVDGRVPNDDRPKLNRNAQPMAIR